VEEDPVIAEEKKRKAYLQSYIKSTMNTITEKAFPTPKVTPSEVAKLVMKTPSAKDAVAKAKRLSGSSGAFCSLPTAP
jgi:hypothetical protein